MIKQRAFIPFWTHLRDQLDGESSQGRVFRRKPAREFVTLFEAGCSPLLQCRLRANASVATSAAKRLRFSARPPRDAASDRYLHDSLRSDDAYPYPQFGLVVLRSNGSARFTLHSAALRSKADAAVSAVLSTPTVLPQRLRPEFGLRGPLHDRTDRTFVTFGVTRAIRL